MRIGKLEIKDTDTPQEKELKLKALRAYEWRLQERIRRKDFAIERGLVDFKKVQAAERKMSREDREIHFKLRPFARFISQEQFEELVQNAIREKNLRNRIEQLKHYRTMGITSLEEAEHYEHERKKRESAELDTRRGRRTRKSTSSTADDTFAIPGLALGGTTAAGILTGPSADLLSSKERDLCKRLQLHPNQYAVVKDAFIREGFRLGHLSRVSALKLLEGAIDPSAAMALYDYFVLCGWIKSP